MIRPMVVLHIRQPAAVHHVLVTWVGLSSVAVLNTGSSQQPRLALPGRSTLST